MQFRQRHPLLMIVWVISYFREKSDQYRRKVRPIYVFQYGSNTSRNRINSPERLAGAARFPRLAQTLEKYELSFTVWSKSNNCAAADLVPDPDRGRNIIGVLYRIPEDRVRRMPTSTEKTLTEIEGPNYHEVPTKVRTQSGRTVKAQTFVVRSNCRQEGIQTSACYVDHILAGLREHGAPQEYIDYVKERAFNNNPTLRKVLDP